MARDTTFATRLRVAASIRTSTGLEGWWRTRDGAVRRRIEAHLDDALDAGDAAKAARCRMWLAVLDRREIRPDDTEMSGSPQ